MFYFAMDEAVRGIRNGCNAVKIADPGVRIRTPHGRDERDERHRGERVENFMANKMTKSINFER